MRIDRWAKRVLWTSLIPLGRHAWLAIFAIALGGRSWAGGGNPTTCQTMCDTLTSTLCVVNTSKTIVPGSVVDCTNARDVQISGGHLLVHDAKFTLKSKSVLLNQ